MNGDVQLLSPVHLDCDMSAREVLRRFAAYGLWLDPTHPAVQERITALAQRLQLPAEAVLQRLAQPVERFGAAIRRQWGLRVLWYARSAEEVLWRCQGAAPDALLIDVLNLHEFDSVPVVEAEVAEFLPVGTSVVMDGGWPVQVVVERPREMMAGAGPDGIDEMLGGAAGDEDQAPQLQMRGDAMAAAPAEEAIATWPRIDAPDLQTAGIPFDVVVGFNGTQQPGVFGGQLRLPVTPGEEWLDVTVELTAGSAIEASDGWQRQLRVRKSDPTGATVTFRLLGLPPTNREQLTLTMLEVRYVMRGTVCGTAVRPIAIAAAGWVEPGGPMHGQPWHDQLAAPAEVALQPDPAAPDLTIEILKPDRNASDGEFMCRLYSPHALATAMGPFQMHLGQDPRTFAKELVDELRVAAGGALLDLTLESNGHLIADRMPREFFAALSEVAARIAPAVPAVLIVSAEPYVPWELAWLDAPMDPARPAFLGAQAQVGRWLRDEMASASPPAGRPQRPATHPNAQLGVQNMAVMAAWYKMESGYRRLPKAEAEAETLAQRFQAVLLKARAESIQQLLRGKLQDKPGDLHAVHFAGHGNFDPNRADASTLYLEDGGAVQSKLFRSARYGGPLQPLLFLNACMGGIGGDVLGDMGGFPGHSLRGGFGGVVAALWEIDDSVAHDVALEFWHRALPAGECGEPVGAILQHLRSQYQPDAPVSTYLSYVYYGHPRLTLQRLH